MAQFEKAVFEAEYKKGVASLKKAEGTVKEQVRVLSRSILEALHNTGNIEYVNGFLRVLTPLNRKNASLYFKEFSGFHFEDSTKEFTKKNGKVYDAVAVEAAEFLDNPLNNMWSWLERNAKEPEKKDVSIEQFKKYCAGFMRKSQGVLTQEEIIKAFFESGVTVESIIKVMENMEPPKAKQELPEALL